MREPEVIEEYRRKISEEEKKIQQEKTAVSVIEKRCEDLRSQIVAIREKILSENDIAYQGPYVQKTYQEEKMKSNPQNGGENKYCPRCGNYVGDDTFCRKCGTKVK
ncbi:MAG: hypothetical protein Q4B37_08285 [Eubacteriales bacterium]|nr:hypothetical protein [Eubacteriales bacterium]